MGLTFAFHTALVFSILPWISFNCGASVSAFVVNPMHSPISHRRAIVLICQISNVIYKWYPWWWFQSHCCCAYYISSSPLDRVYVNPPVVKRITSFRHAYRLVGARARKIFHLFSARVQEEIFSAALHIVISNLKIYLFLLFWKEDYKIPIIK